MTGINSIKGAIFDMDGTLFDSMWMWHLVEAEYMSRFEEKPGRDFTEILRFLNMQEVTEFIRVEYGVVKAVEEVTSEVNAMMEDFYFRKVLLKPGVFSVLDMFRSRGIKMCVATATDRYLVEGALKKAEIFGYFERIFTCGEEKTNKKSPDIFNRAAAFLGTDNKETLVFEDALFPVKSAKNAGFPVVGVYDEAAVIHQDEIKALCDIYCLSMDEILDRM